MATIIEQLRLLKSLDRKSMPLSLSGAYDYVKTATSEFTSTDNYLRSEKVRAVIDAFIAKVSIYLSKENSTKSEKAENPQSTQSSQKSQKTQKSPSNKADTDNDEQQTELIQNPKSVALVPDKTDEDYEPVIPKPKKESVKRKSPKVESQDQEPEITLTERIPEEIKLIKRYVSFHRKRKTKADYLRLINALQKAIIEKHIRKTSEFAEQIKYIQTDLLNTYNTMRASHIADFGESRILEYKALAASQKVMPAVQLIKRYLSLNGKFEVKEKARNLLKAFERMVELKLISPHDKYAAQIEQMFENLKLYVSGKKSKVLSITKAELNGLNGVLEACGCQMQGLDGLGEIHRASSPPENVISSMDLANMTFKTIGFKGKYLDLIGDPCAGFRALIYGRPKMGKSSLCIDFASYLANHHGKVLYVAREEGVDYTLKSKIVGTNKHHPNLHTTDTIPEDLSYYDYICFDSVNKLGLTPEDLEAIHRAYPQKNFIYVFQSTKDGSLRGTNEFAHDVDIIINVPEVGKAIQNGRFNQGGEMNIFES